MGKRKRKLTAAERAAKKRRKAEFQTVFIGGKQKRVRRAPTIDGMSVDEFIRRNADPIFLHEMEMWELLEEPGASDDADGMRDGWRGKHAARHPELTMIVEPAGDMFLARCPELGIASRGFCEEDARANLAEEVEIFFEAAEQFEASEERADELAIVEREGDGFVSVCPELDIASQGDTAEEARANLEEALELFFDVADESEVRRRRRIAGR